MDAEVDAKAANRARFELELEFVQALANPFYLHSLAQQNILEQPAFVNFLKYLLYFKEKDYARFIQYVYTFEIFIAFTTHSKLSTCTPSFRATSTCPIPFTNEKRRIFEGISSSKAIWSLADLVSHITSRIIYLLSYTPQRREPSSYTDHSEPGPETKKTTVWCFEGGCPVGNFDEPRWMPEEFYSTFMLTVSGRGWGWQARNKQPVFPDCNQGVGVFFSDISRGEWSGSDLYSDVYRLTHRLFLHRSFQTMR